MTDSQFDATLTRAIAAAGAHAGRRRHRLIRVEHLLRALLDEEEARSILQRCGADLDELIRELDDYLDLLEEVATAPRPQVDADCDALLAYAVRRATASGRAHAGVGGVLEGLIRMDGRYAALLLRAAGSSGIDGIDLRRVVSHGVRDFTPEAPPGDRLIVKLHNDDYTTMEFVVAVFTELFGMPLEKATELMLEIHKGGAVAVAELAAKDAVRRVGVVHARAHAREFPLRCTLEAVK